MSCRLLSPSYTNLLAAPAVAILLVSAPLWGQITTTVSAWTVPRTPDGQPDLQGVWNDSTLTPLQRPKEFANKQFLSEQETAALEKVLAKRSDYDREDAPAQPGSVI